MATITNTVKWVDNTADLKAAILAGTDSIVAMKTQVDRMAQSLGGSGLLAAANRTTAAIEQLGGVTKLTGAEQARVNALIEKALDKYQALGVTAPSAMQSLYDATKQADDSTQALEISMKDAFENPLGAIKQASTAVGGAALETAGLSAGILAAGAAVGAAVVGLTEVAAHAREMAAAIHDVHEVTGLSVPAVSNLKFAWEAAGSSLENMSALLFTFDKRMEDNGKAVETGLGKIGLSIDELKSMAPEERLLAISSGLRSVGDDSSKAAIAFELFGKQGRDNLPVLLKPLEDLVAKGQELGPVTKAAAQAADDFEVSLNTVKAQASQTWTQLGLNVSIMDQLTYAWERGKLAVANIAYTFTSAVVGVATLDQYLPALIDHLRGVANELPQVTGPAAKGVKDMKAAVDDLKLKPLSLESAELTRIEKDLADQAKRVSEEHKKAADAAQRHADSVKSQVDALRGMSASQDIELEAMRKIIDAGDADVATKARIVNALDKLHTEHVRIPADLDAWRVANESLGDSYQKLLKTIGDVVLMRQRAGGTVLKEDLDKLPTGAPLLDKFPKLKSNPVAAMLGPSLSDSLMKDLQSVPNTIVSALTGGGGLMGAVEGIGSQIGSTLGQSVGKGLSVLGKLGGPIGSAIGSLAGPLLGKAVDWIGNLFGAQEKQVNKTRQAYVDAAGGLDVLNQRAHAAGVTLDALLNAKKPQDYTRAVNELNDALKFQDDAMATLDATVKKYNFSVDQTGPIFAKQELEKKFGELYQDWQVLKSSGMDLDTIISGMGSSMNDFVHESLKTGTEIPAAMAPMLQRMVELGQLTDANGDVITDLDKSGVHFSMTMTQGVEKIVSSVQKLTDAIARGLGLSLDDASSSASDLVGSLDKLPTDKTVRVHVQSDGGITDPMIVNDVVDGAATGGLATRMGIQHFADGGNVLSFKPMGTDTVPAMLTPGEIVLNVAQQRRVAAALSGGGHVVNFEAMRAELAATRRQQEAQSAYMQTQFTRDLSRAVRDEVQKVSWRRSRA